ncbi:MAG: hypothetical protein AABY80_01500, partial [Candidatus Deferrimicrobiota bacterium]
YWEAGGLLPSYENFDFPGFVLTTKDGTKYTLERETQGEVLTESGATLTPYTGGKLKRIEVPSGDRLEFEREADGLLRIDHFNPAGDKTKSLFFTRDAQNRIVGVYEAANVDANGQPTGPASVSYEYDAAGNLVSVSQLTDASNPSDPSYRTIRYVYGNAQHPHYITEIVDPRGIAPLRTEYDEAGRIVATVDALGNRVALDHDLAARTETVWDRSGNPTVHVYDTRGNVLASTDPLGHTVLRTYDEANNELAVTDPLGNTTRKTWDASGNLLSVASVTSVFRYSYDSRGNQLTVTDPLGHVTSNTYDSAGNLLATVNALGQLNENVYDAQGNLTQIKDVLGRV